MSALTHTGGELTGETGGDPVSGIYPVRHGPETNSDFRRRRWSSPDRLHDTDARWQETPQRGAPSSTYAERRLTPRSVCARPDSHSAVITTGAPLPRIPHVYPYSLFPFLPRSPPTPLPDAPPLPSPPRFQPPNRPLNREISKNAFNSCVFSRRTYSHSDSHDGRTGHSSVSFFFFSRSSCLKIFHTDTERSISLSLSALPAASGISSNI